MHSICQTILQNYQMRKTAAQKTAFITYMQQQFPQLRVETAGKSRNLVAGDVAGAKIIFTAHYDTCGRSLWPNISMPFRPGLKFAYSMLTLLPLIIAMLVTAWGLMWLQVDRALALLAGLAVYYIGFFVQFFGMPANPNTANDNTSGVCLLVRLLETMTDQQREKVAVVFFDDEEKGCVGSKAFRKRHKAETEKTLIFNFDCIADGDHIFFLSTPPAQEAWEPLLRQAFRDGDGLKVGYASSKQAKYSSDQKRFPVSIGTAALTSHPILGYYFARIHTPKDTVFSEKNMEFLRTGLLTLLDSLTD